MKATGWNSAPYGLEGSVTLRLRGGATTWNFQTNGSHAINWNRTNSLNTWYFVVVINDGGMLDLILDNVSLGAFSETMNSTEAAETGYLPILGQMGYVAYVEGVLPPSTITDLYNAGLPFYS
jgi:hypothetical protein